MIENGIFFCGIFGNGEGLVVFDSDEYDEEGYIIENLDLRRVMVLKCLRKFEVICVESFLFILVGFFIYKMFFISWGFSYFVV